MIQLTDHNPPLLNHSSESSSPKWTVSVQELGLQNKRSSIHPRSSEAKKTARPDRPDGVQTLDHARVHWLPKIWSTLERVESECPKKKNEIRTNNSVERGDRLSVGYLHQMEPISVPRQTRFCCIMVDCTVGLIWSDFLSKLDPLCVDSCANASSPLFCLVYLPRTNQ